MFPRLQDERAFAVALLRLARSYRREVDRALAAHGLSEAKALPLVQIARLGEGVRQGMLADVLGVEGPSLVQILDQLCAAGLAERREDPNDRRAKTLHLTEPGRTVAAAAERTLDDFRARLLTEIGDDDLGTCLGVLSRFEAAVDQASARSPSSGG